LEVLAAFIMVALIIEAASTSGTSGKLYQTTWCNIPEDIRLSMVIFITITSFLYSLE
jgi:p-aminobenzoyl-glutamate transporter AbgT